MREQPPQAMQIPESSILFQQETITEATQKIAQQINQLNFDEPVLLLGVMTGSLVWLGHLLPLLHIPIELDTLRVSRYDTQQPQKLQWHHKPRSCLKNRHILIVDDIIDEGITLMSIIKHCQAQQAKSIHSAVLLNRLLPERQCQADFTGLDIADGFVFGYGLDHKQTCRNLKHIYLLS